MCNIKRSAGLLIMMFLLPSVLPGVAIACSGGEGEFPSSITISPSPYKYPAAENKEFVIKNTSLIFPFEIENVRSSNAKFKPRRECVTGHELLAGEKCKEHVEFVAPFEKGQTAVLTVETFGGDETDNLSS